MRHKLNRPKHGRAGQVMARHRKGPRNSGRSEDGVRRLGGRQSGGGIFANLMKENQSAIVKPDC